MLNSIYLSAVQNQLSQFAAQANFSSVFATAFGSSFDPLLLESLQQQWLAGDFSVIPNIVILTNGELAGAKGAYAAETNTIYVSSDFLATASDQQVAAVLLEEIGHRIDTLLNGGVDSAGDEGEIFSLLVNGAVLSPEILAALKLQNDHAVITVGGQLLAVEKATTFGSTRTDDTILGTADNDSLYGGNNDSTLLVNPGTIDTYTGNDILFGYGGDDYLYGGDGNDKLYGMSGDDRLYGGYGNDKLEGDDGNDFLYDEGGTDTLEGGNGDDTLRTGGVGTIYGGNGNDDILTSASNDTIYGGEGDDTIFANGGSNYVNAGEGNNYINTGNDKDYITSGGGNDLIIAGDGDNEIFAGNGNDNIFAGSGNDSIEAGNGINSITGGEGNNTLKGGADRDNIQGGSGQDIIDGDGGDDYIASYGGNDTINGGNGNNTLDGGEGNNQITGGNDSDIITGRSGLDTIDGGAGDDNIDAGDGNDNINGGNGNDTIYGGAGINTIIGGLGDDSIFAGSGVYLNTSLPSSFVYCGNGNDTVFGTRGADVITGDEGNDNISAYEGNDTIIAGEGSDFVFGGNGNDSMTGGGGNDVLFGESNDDIITGDEGDDTISGGSGNNTLGGGNGNDNIVGGIADDVITGDFGDDYLSGDNPDDIFNGGNDYIEAGNGNDTVIGGLGLDTISGGAGDDSIDGGDGKDYIYGDYGNNTLSGGNGDDVITGGNERDTIYGGAGADKMYGGFGDDYYTIDDIGDLVVDYGGLDTVDSYIAFYQMGNDIENASTYSGNVTGNALDNNISARNGDNLLVGGDGNDTLSGSYGKDTLRGGTGNDTYFVEKNLNFYSSSGTEINDESGVDKLLINSGFVVLDIDTNISKVGTSLLLDLNGDKLFNAADDLKISNFFNANNIAGSGFIESINNLTGASIIEKFRLPANSVTKETDGNTDLAIINGKYVAVDAVTNEMITVTYADEIVGVNSFPNWSVIAAEKASNGDMQYLWKHTSGQFWYSTSNSTGKAVSSNDILPYEAIFQQDLNGNGVIYPVIENAGTTKLSLNTIGKYSASNGNVTLDVVYNNRIVGENSYAGWKIVGAEINTTNDNVSVVWKSIAGQYWYSTNTDNGGLVSNIALQETAFQQNFNGDDVIGSNIEAAGTTTLTVKLNGDYRAFYNDTEYAIKYDGATIGINSATGWAVVGAEVVGTEVKAIWKSDGGQFWYSTNTDNGSLVADVAKYEFEFQQDFNKDGFITQIGTVGDDTLGGSSINELLTGGAGIDTFVLKATNNGIDKITDFAANEFLNISDFGLGAFNSSNLQIFTGTGTPFGTSVQQFILDSSNGDLYFDYIGGFAVKLATLQGVTNLTAANFKI
jgi:Ca2+-binding RTX toxin-like protein